MKKALYWTGGIVIALAGVFAAGPRPVVGDLSGDLPVVNTSLVELAQEINRREAANPLVKPDNQARIVWADSTRKQKTPVSLVYLHGFGASQAEGAPVHTMLAERYGANLYLARLKEQGIESDSAFKRLTAANLLASAREAVAIGFALGERVIVVSTSTGSTLGLKIASEHPELAGLIMYSPLIAPRDEQLYLLNQPWGVQAMEASMGADHLINERTGRTRQYWSRYYHINGYVTLAVLVEETMTEETFRQVTCPVFLGYYYKSEEEQDQVVSVAAMHPMFEQLGTPAEQKRKVAFPEAGNHVIGSYIRSRDWRGVYQATDQFMQEVIRETPVREVKAPAYAEREPETDA
ncbi:MAG: alpha/beta hydrolase [Tunicatimonas sp.]